MVDKKLLLSILSLATIVFFSSTKSFGQNIAVNSTGVAANASSMLDISSGASNNRGLLIPRVTSAQKTAMNPLPAAAQGLVVYQTDGVEGFYFNTSTTTTPAWSYLTPGGWSLTGNSGTTAGTNFIGTIDAVDWVVKTTNTERMRVLAGGNVGIGIAIPTQRLDVQGGNARINNAFIGDVGHGANWGGISHSLQNSTTGYALIESNDGAYTLINKQNTGSGYIGFRVANSDMAVILNNGNVGLGLTNPAYNLEINGSFGYGDGSAGSYRSRTETRNDAGQIAGQSGFFQTSAPSPASSWPTGAGSWWHLLDIRHSNNLNNYAMQFSGSFFDQNLYFRKTNGAANTAWSQVLTTSSLLQGITMSSATAEVLIAGNNTGTYSSAAGVGYTPGTYVSVPGLSTTRTISTGNVVQVTFSGRWETDDFNYWTSEMIWFRVLRDGTVIATSAVFTDGGSYWYFTDGNISITTQDTGASAGAHTWTVECWLANTTASTEAFFMGERYLTVTEIKQ